MDFENCNWSSAKEDLISYLKSLANDKYKNFSKGLIPGEFEMIGVNLPTLKKIAKEIRTGDYETFLEMDDENIFELKFLKGQVIANTKDVREYERRFWIYLPSITDWSLCDSFIAASKVIKKDRTRFFAIADDLIKRDNEFQNRVGFIILLDYFIDEEYFGHIEKIIAAYKDGSYYADMALSWLLSVMYVKFPEDTFAILESGHISQTVLKYTIRKVKDSYRVTAENKDKLKRLA